ncbi:hypothetical protein CFII64_13798 [Pseudomonas sp. CFII64]|nr:hypothetical protein CFII64_13798 [Pseudomonas sp. CFII64]
MLHSCAFYKARYSSENADKGLPAPLKMDHCLMT